MCNLDEKIRFAGLLGDRQSRRSFFENKFLILYSGGDVKKDSELLWLIQANTFTYHNFTNVFESGGGCELRLIKVAILLLVAILNGGCSDMGDVKNNADTPVAVPETLAAQDEYTRSFLVSTDEVSDGHYAFKPWTDAYTMWIPTDATLDSVFYEKKEKHWERFMYAWKEENENISYLLYGQFENRPDSEEVGLDNLSFFAKYEGEYSKSEDEENIYYYGKSIDRVGEEGEEKIPVYSHIGFIKHKNSGKSLGILYDHNCSDWTTNCDADTERIKDHFWELVKSVKFED